MSGESKTRLAANSVDPTTVGLGETYSEKTVIGGIFQNVDWKSRLPQVRTFVNGTLYSLLSRPKIRAAAREMDLPALLRAVAKRADATCARQIGHVLTRVHAAADAAETSDSADSSGGEVLEPARVRKFRFQHTDGFYMGMENVFSVFGRSNHLSESA